MGYTFDAEKTAEAIGYMFQEAGWAEVEILKLLKLVFLADRESYRVAGFPITGDALYAMPHGPVPSETYDLLKTTADWPEPNDSECLWGKHFQRQEKLIRLLLPTATGRLSKHDRAVLKAIVQEHGDKSAAQLRAETHQLPEWFKNDPHGSSKAIPLRDILESVGRSEDLVAIEAARSEDAAMDKIFFGS